MKAYCAMHDLILNYSEKRWEQDVNQEGNCKCCDRTMADGHGMELKLDLLGNIVQDTCNCFITGDGKGYYTKEELADYNLDRTVESTEQCDRDYQLQMYYEERKIEGTNEYGYYKKEELIA